MKKSTTYEFINKAIAIHNNKYDCGDSEYKKRQDNDETKNNFAKNNNIDLLRIKYYEMNNINQILKEVI